MKNENSYYYYYSASCTSRFAPDLIIKSTVSILNHYQKIRKFEGWGGGPPPTPSWVDKILRNFQIRKKKF